MKLKIEPEIKLTSRSSYHAYFTDLPITLSNNETPAVKDQESSD